MTNSPAHEKEDPMVGKAGTEAGAPKQQTGAEQRPDASGTKKEQSGTESPGGAGISDSAIKAGDDAANKLDAANESRAEVETGGKK